MTTSKEQIAFVSACKDFFGFLPGQRPMDFGKEVQALTNEDRIEIASGLAKNGYNIAPDTIERK